MELPDERAEAISTLRAAGLRVTGTRLSVWSALRASPHFTTEELAKEARRSLGSVSTQAVYKALDAFSEAGLVRRIEPAGSAVRYETRTGDNHHHLVCRSCGIVADVDCLVDAVPCLTPSQDLGFLIDQAEVVFWGYCQQCQISRDSKEDQA